MALLRREDIVTALRELGRLAEAEGTPIRLIAVGGAVMSLRHDARETTRDIDVVIVEPEAASVRNLAAKIAASRGWPSDWLNDAAKAYLQPVENLTLLLKDVGIQVFGVSDFQMLAMKLAAWRDEVDISDARLLLKNLTGERDVIWSSLERFIPTGLHLKASLAFQDLWEDTYGQFN